MGKMAALAFEAVKAYMFSPAFNQRARSFLGWSLSVKIHWLLLFLLLSFLRVYVVAVHESWRDETQPFLVARESTSFWDLIQAARYERSHALWPVALYWMHQMGWDSVFDMQVLYLLMSVAVLAIIIYGMPQIPLALRGLLGSSYLLLYEYTALPRPYGFTILFLAIFLMLELRRKHLWWKALPLFLMAFSNIMGLVLAIALSAGLFTNIPRGEIRNRLLFGGVMVVAVVLSVLSAWPPPDILEDLSLRQYRSTALEFFGIPRALSVGAHLLVDGFLYVPKVTEFYWWNGPSILRVWPANHTGLDYLIGIVAWLLAFWGLRLLHKRDRGMALAALILWIGGAGVLFTSHTGHIRHMGVVVLGSLAILAIVSLKGGKLSLHLKQRIFLYGLLIGYSFGGLFAVYMDGKEMFSQAINVSRWLQANEPNSIPIIYPAAMGQGIAAYDKGRYYVLEGEKVMTFMRSDTSMTKPVTPLLVDNMYLKPEGEVLVTDFPYAVRSAKGKFTAEPVAAFYPAMERTENFWIYRIRPFQEDSESGDDIWKMELSPFQPFPPEKAYQLGFGHIRTSGDQMNPFSLTDDAISNRVGTTAEVRLRLLDWPSADPNGMIFSIQDGKREGKISFFGDRIAILDQNLLRATYSMDTTDGFYTYRIAVVGDNMEVSVDGKAVASVTLVGQVGAKSILLGDFSQGWGENAEALVDYLSYAVDGAIDLQGKTAQPADEIGLWTRFFKSFLIKTKGRGIQNIILPEERLDNSKGATVELKMRLSEAPLSGREGAILSLLDGRREGKVSFFQDRLEIRDSNELKAVYRMNPLDGWHIYRLAVVSELLEFYVDGEKVASVTLSNPVGEKKILLGDFSGETGENMNATIDYLAYTVAGALPPPDKE